MQVGVVGISFKTADLALREAVARGSESLSGEKALFFPHPTVLLSTCNRTEIYFSAEDLASAHVDLIRWLRFFIKEPFEPRLYSYFGIDCFAHLCKVASGLDSAILAETEIQQQVKKAYAESAKVFALPSSLHYAFQKALKVGKSVRSSLEMERGAPSLYGTLWQILQEKKGKPKSVLLVGNSKINRGFLSFLLQKEVRSIVLCTKNPLSIEGALVKDRSELAHWPSYDLIVCASKSDGFLIRGKAEESPLIFDLGVPRNVDPAIQGALLYNIEQINQIIEQKRRAQRHELERGVGEMQAHVLCLYSIYKEKTLNKKLFI